MPGSEWLRAVTIGLVGGVVGGIVASVLIVVFQGLWRAYGP